MMRVKCMKRMREAKGGLDVFCCCSFPQYLLSAEHWPYLKYRSWVGVVVWNCFSQDEKWTHMLQLTELALFKIKAIIKVYKSHLHLSAVLLVCVISAALKWYCIFKLNACGVRQGWRVGGPLMWYRVVLRWLIKRYERQTQVLFQFAKSVSVISLLRRSRHL